MINRMMRFIVGANSFVHKAPNLPAGRQANEFAPIIKPNCRILG